MTADILTNPVDLYLLTSGDDMIPEGVIEDLSVMEGVGHLDVRVDMVGEKMIFMSIDNKLLHAYSYRENSDAFPYNIEPPNSN